MRNEEELDRVKRTILWLIERKRDDAPWKIPLFIALKRDGRNSHVSKQAEKQN